MTEEQKPECIPIDDDNHDVGGGVDADADAGVNSEPEEWSVEAIRGKRKNPETGATEFLIKWEGWSENDNSWEPLDNLKCPAIIREFEEEQRKKRQRRSNATRASSSSATPTTRGRQKKVNGQTLRSSNINSHTNGQTTSSFLLENDGDEVSNFTERPPSTNLVESTDPTPENNHSKDLTESAWQQPKGFGRGVNIEKIVGSCIDDKDKLFFFIKWADSSELEMVDANEIEDKAPKKLCKWYRERLYFAIKNPLEPPITQ